MRNKKDPLRGYSRILVPEDDGRFSAEMLELPGCVAQGDTADEALRNLEAAAIDWMQSMQDQGGTIPEPLTGHGFSGAVSLRLPRSLHRRSMQLAARDKTSQNQFLVSTIAARIGAEDLYRRLSEHLCEEICERMVAKLSQGVQVHVTNQAMNIVLVLGSAGQTAEVAASQQTAIGPVSVSGGTYASGTVAEWLIAPTALAETR